ncbi:hypothetical protein QAD02_017466 [Eretmocerus hayati]|uniref:Uncharacterized protein n=1 Tax=Eretmocerus hayati TaxID=131215 RepID=A0ACC2PED4_9HYME|nr:hypothetical protein QAD02_017466 [Eretmocerus hayati]
MELIEQPFEKKNRFCGEINRNLDPNFNCNAANQKSTVTKCIRKYVQPPRVQPFTPKKAFCPPQNPVESKTTYCTSFYEAQIQAPPKPVKPSNNLALPNAEFAKDTTTHESYKPVWNIYKAKPIIQRQKLRPQCGPMQNETTIRKDYTPKFVNKPEPVIPCGNIRTSNGSFETKTTTLTSFLDPGPVEPVTNFKPRLAYCPPTESTAKETTTKLSFLPYEPQKKDDMPWAQKPRYKPPEVSMPKETTYNKSYLEAKSKREEPIVPKDTGVFPRNAEFYDHTVYKQSFVPQKTEPVAPVVPCGNISLSNKSMVCDTTNKLSFKPVLGEKRKPILPRQKRPLWDKKYFENHTTTKLSFTPKVSERLPMIIPCGNICSSNKPLEGKTTTTLSFPNPGRTDPVQNFKPQLAYCRPNAKVEGDTVNQLSYKEWPIGPKPDMPWARKKAYEPPRQRVEGDTVTHTSFPPPGHFVEECIVVEEAAPPPIRSSCPCESADDSQEAVGECQ